MGKHLKPVHVATSLRSNEFKVIAKEELCEKMEWEKTSEKRLKKYKKSVESILGKRVKMFTGKKEIVLIRR